MAPRRDGDAEQAYFVLLRAREDETALQRYQEWLLEEQRRLRRFAAETDAHAEEIDRRLRRALLAVDRDLTDALKARLRVLSEESATLQDRLAAAAEYVAACEAAHDALR